METLDSGGASRWFYDFSGNRIGPLEPHEIRAAITAGRIQPDTPLMETGGAAWRRAEDSMFGPFFKTGPIPRISPLPRPVRLNVRPTRPGVDVATGTRMPSSARMPLRMIAGAVDWLAFCVMYALLTGVIALIYAALAAIGLWRWFLTDAPTTWGDAFSHIAKVTVEIVPAHALALAVYSRALLGYFVLGHSL